MPLNRREVEAGLKRKGFRGRGGDHHFFIYITRDGRKTLARTKTSHSKGEISDTLLGLMARQCKVPRQRFDALLKCSLGREEYEQILARSGGM